MKSFKQFFSLFCCSLLCCMLFSVPANAATFTGYNVTQEITYQRYEEPTHIYKEDLSITYQPTNSTLQNGNQLVSNKFKHPNGSLYLRSIWTITGITIPKGYHQVNFNKAFFRCTLMPENKSKSKHFFLDNGEVSVYGQDANGDWHYAGNATYQYNSIGFYNFSVTFEFNFPIYALEFTATGGASTKDFADYLTYHSGSDTYWCYMNMYYGEAPSSSSSYIGQTSTLNVLSLDNETGTMTPDDDGYVTPDSGNNDNSATLEGIWSDLTTGFNTVIENTTEYFSQMGTAVFDIYQSVSGGFSDLIMWVTEGFNNVVEGITNTVNGIAQLPGKIWDKIENGLEKLFIPDGPELQTLIQDLNYLLQDKFGGIAEAFDMIRTLYESITADVTADSISFPKVTIPVGQGETFTFGGWDVKIVVNKFSGIYSTLQLIIGVIATLAFIGGLRRRYDEVMGVEK